MNDLQGQKLDAYLAVADSWADDSAVQSARSQRTAWIVAGVASAIALLEAVAIVVMLPLKTVEPYTLLVDKQTGYVQELKPLQGAILQAVLETALDSTRAGPARAIISRDVRSFDGTRVLIQRGSRLYGEYKADLSSGQNRALIQWQRLMRPDGAVIELDSPSADPLGRAGVKGKVNTHFFERFGGAILQSTLDLGVALATRNVTNGTIVVGLPGSMPQITATQPDQVKPTLKVPQGAAVSVFVARDLDFTKVEQ